MADEPQTQPVKGYKSSEFWFSVATFIVGAVLASGAIGEQTQAFKILAYASSTLAALGYTVSRGIAKINK